MAIVDELVSRHPNSGSARRLRANIYNQAHHADRGVADLEHAVTLSEDPTRAISLFQLGLRRAADRPRSNELIEAAYALDPRLVPARLQMFRILQERRADAQARGLIHATLYLAPDVAPLYTQAASHARAAGHRDEELRFARAATWLAPQLGEPFVFLARALLASGRLEDARRALARARARPVDPALAQTLTRLAEQLE